MSNTRELVDTITTGNNVEAERIFKDNMAARVGDKLEMQRREVANSFEKTIKDVSKRYKVSEKELMSYFEREMLNI